MRKFCLFCALFSLSVFISNSQEIEDLPLFDITQLTYKGAFRIEAKDQGISSINYCQGPIAYNADNHSLYVVGSSNQQAIAEYPIPEIIESKKLSELAISETPIQVFTQVLSKTSDGNPEEINTIGGLYYYNKGGQGKLVVNGYVYYDAARDTNVSTFVINDANAIEASSADGYFGFDGGAGHTSGWISPIPKLLQEALGGSHITGQSSGIPIITRLTVGPSAFAFDMKDVLNASSTIPTSRLLDFSFQNPLHEDLSNSTRNNDIWTHLSRVNYGVIVPGTRTYLTIGYSGGHESGICYKCHQDNGIICHGRCSLAVDDNYQFYWLWDVKDLLAVKEGTIQSYEVRPYDFGKLNTPFQAGGHKKISGGSFDQKTGDLYLTVDRGDTEQGFYDRPPVVTVYNVNSKLNDTNELINDPEITIYPNPALDRLFIEGLIFESEIRINDISGRLIMIEKYEEENIEINLSGFATGAYVIFLKNKSTNVVYMKKVVKL